MVLNVLAPAVLSDLIDAAVELRTAHFNFLHAGRSARLTHTTRSDEQWRCCRQALSVPFRPEFSKP